MTPDEQFHFPSPRMAAALQQQVRLVHMELRNARRNYGKDPDTYNAIAAPLMRIARVRSRLAREHLFALIGDGRLEDCPKSWTW